jgi:methylated-DNA-[protein]-cysteine S-methyltransferase
VVKEIPRGSVLTYKDVAKMAGSPLAARAVGQILKKNFEPDIPCHRVVGASDLGGYNRGKEKKFIILIGEGVDIKSLLARRHIPASN